MLPFVAERVQRDWEALFPQQQRPRALRFLGISGSLEGGTATFLAFAAGSATPLFAVKIHRDPVAEARARNEFAVLGYLQSCGGLLAKSVPEPIFCERISGAWCLGQTILLGVPMAAELDPSGLPSIGFARTRFDLAVQWLAQLHTATQVTDAEVGASIAAAQRRVDECLTVFPLTPAEVRRLDALRDRLAGILDGGVVVEHGDFTRHNLLQPPGSDRDVNVIDWTDARQHGLPLHDLLFFLATYFLQIRRQTGLAGFHEAFAKTFIERNPYSQLVQSAVQDYCTATRIGREHLDSRFLLFLVGKALGEYHSVRAAAQRQGLARFPVFIGASQTLTYAETMRHQLWFHFLRLFLQHTPGCFAAPPG